MSDLNKAILKVAQSNPEFRRALVAELQKDAGDWGAGPKKVSDLLRKLYVEGVSRGLRKHEPGDTTWNEHFDKQKAAARKLKDLLERISSGRAPTTATFDLIAHLLFEDFYNKGVIEGWEDH